MKCREASWRPCPADPLSTSARFNLQVAATHLILLPGRPPFFCPSVSYKRAATTGQGHTNHAADALQLPLPGFLKDDGITEQCGFRISDLGHVPNTKLNFHPSFLFLQMTRKSTREMMCTSLATKKVIFCRLYQCTVSCVSSTCIK